MVKQVSGKLTSALLGYAEKQGIALSILLEYFDGPEEFLRDSHFWLDLAQGERMLARASRVSGDPVLGYNLGSQICELQALGAMDHVFKMMHSKADYYRNLGRFFSYFLSPSGDFKEIEHGKNFVRFRFPFSGIEFPQTFGFLRGVLENLPRYTGQSPATAEWNHENHEMLINWESSQSSLFEEEPGQVLNPKLIQDLSDQLESSERALQAKKHEVMTLKAEVDQLRHELHTQVREKVYSEKMSGLAQLAAGVAHEINNPLSFVMSNLTRFEEYFKRVQNYIQRIEGGGSPAQWRRELDVDFVFSETPTMLKESREGLTRVKEIVKDLSSLAHPQAYRSENRMMTDLNGLVESCLKVFQDQLGQHIRIEKRFGLKKSVKVYPVRISQVIMNLLSNAIHAIPEAGIIQITTGEMIRDGRAQAYLEVADSGVGMDEVILNRIFTPFFTTKEVGHGTGLGLVIAQSIVEMHKGRIDVASEKGGGSRFTVFLPLEAQLQTHGESVMSKITKINAREILDSRGNPTVEVDVFLEDGSLGRAAVPSGASTGADEALELRDGEANRYKGKGVRKAVAHIREILGPKIVGKDAGQQAALDQFMIDLDGTETKSNLGANAILGVSLAVAKAHAVSQGVSLYKSLKSDGPYKLPVPLMNILNGGAHADNGLDIQEFMIVPVGGGKFSEALRYGSEVFHTLKSILNKKGLATGVGDEGGFAPLLKSNLQALELVSEGVEKAGFKLGEDIVLALDVAATELFDSKTQKYRWEGRTIDSAELIKIYNSWSQNFPLLSIEDGLAEDDWSGWKAMTDSLGKRVQLVGDDLFVTNKKRILRGIESHTANAVLIKVNQIGTLTETFEAISVAHKAGYHTVMSHRSGETEDATIADLAVASGSQQIKTGSLCRGERTAKYNQLLRIEEELGAQAQYWGSSAFARK